MFTRQALINAVWGGQWVGDDHLVDVHVLHIRQKLGDTATEQNYVPDSPRGGIPDGAGAMIIPAGAPVVRGIAARLVIAMTLVVIAGGVTAFLVATLVGPALFLQHVTESGGASQDAIGHAEEAFRSASTLATTIALGSATVTSVAASVFLARRIGASLRTMAEASTRLAAGRFDTRVTAPGVGAEFRPARACFQRYGRSSRPRRAAAPAADGGTWPMSCARRSPR